MTDPESGVDLRPRQTATYEPPEWRVGAPREPVPLERWGKDHWSTFAYIEVRTVDHRGALEHDHMRCSPGLHPMLRNAGRRNPFGASTELTEYPTRVKGEQRPGGGWTMVDLPGLHDDYVCIADMVAAGLVEVVMPEPDPQGAYFQDERGRPVNHPGGGVPIDPHYFTGLDEWRLTAKATYRLTEAGREIAAQLRAHKANGGSFHQFQPTVGNGDAAE